jgi:hypothetical protein
MNTKPEIDVDAVVQRIMEAARAWQALSEESVSGDVVQAVSEFKAAIRAELSRAPAATNAKPTAFRVRSIFPQGPGPWNYFSSGVAHAKQNEEIEYLYSAPHVGAPAAPAEAYMACEDCDGRGVVGEEIYQGEFQPPEREQCGSCNGSGRWKIDATQQVEFPAVEPVTDEEVLRHIEALYGKAHAARSIHAGVAKTALESFLQSRAKGVRL